MSRRFCWMRQVLPLVVLAVAVCAGAFTSREARAAESALTCAASVAAQGAEQREAFEVILARSHFGAGADNTAGVPAQRLYPRDLVYQGAFRLPDQFNWGALGMSFYPGGQGGAGSLLVTGFQAISSPEHPGSACWNPAWDCYAFYGQVSIPAPAVREDWQSLPMARLLGGMVNFDQGLVARVSRIAREKVFVSDIEFVPKTGAQSRDKIYGSANFWYPEGDFGQNSFPTVWMANLDGSGARGLFHVGPVRSPFHGRKSGSYLFTVPPWYANQYLGGRRLVTGRSRGTPAEGRPVTLHGGSQGPTLFAFRAVSSDTPSGNLDALPMLHYRVKYPGCAGPNIGPTPQCDYPDFTMCDDWTGGAFVDDGGRRAIMLLGWKGLGRNCYGGGECRNPCGDYQGYHCNPYERQVLLYDVHAIGAVARGAREPWTVLPYAVWRPSEFFQSGNTCWNAGGMTFDPASGRMFMVERGLGGETNAAVVHVWKTGSGLQVLLQPPQVHRHGGWRKLGVPVWRGHGFTERLPPGVHVIQFRPIAGWRPPANRQVLVRPDRVARISALYTVPQGLRVLMEPAQARQAGARWRRVGTDAWRIHGFQERLPLGRHLIQFRPVSGRQTPAPRPVFVPRNQLMTIMVHYH